MPFVCCLAGLDRTDLPMFDRVLRAAGVLGTPTVNGLNVSELGTLGPSLLVCDVDDSGVDALELLRRIRFVLPDCMIAVYTRIVKRTWGMECHLAGANCVLSKSAGEATLAAGILDALGSGCYTDPSFAAA